MRRPDDCRIFVGDRLKVGDIVRSLPRKGIDPITGEPYGTVTREIVAVRRDGTYEWRYPDYPDRTFLSRDSNDYYFYSGWELIAQAVPALEAEAAKKKGRGE